MTLKHVLAAACLGALFASTAAAQEVDADGDGMVTLEELLAVYPTVTEETFAAADTDADGMLSADELAAAQEVGLIPAES